MILKFLLIALVIAIVYFMFFKSTPSIKENKNKPKNAPAVNDMVECNECGIYVEIEESILSNGKYYCSKECLAKAN